MKVKIEYHDNESLTVEEVVAQAYKNYGKNVKVELNPESSIAYDHVYFGVQQLLTHRQASILYDRGSDYQAELKGLRAEVLEKLTEIVEQVIIDNESRLS